MSSSSAAPGSLGPEIEFRGPRTPADAFLHVKHAFEDLPHVPQSRRRGPVLLGTADEFRIVGPGAFFGKVTPAPDGCRIVGRWGRTREQQFVSRYGEPLAGVAAVAGVLWYYPVRETWFLVALAAALFAVPVVIRRLVPSEGAQRAVIESILRTSVGAKD